MSTPCTRKLLASQRNREGTAQEITHGEPLLKRHHSTLKIVQQQEFNDTPSNLKMRSFRFRMIISRLDDSPHESHHSAASLRRNMFTVKFVVFTGVFLGHVTVGRYIALDDILTFLNFTWPPAKQKGGCAGGAGTTCETEVCKESAKDILDGLDPNIDPCDDFYSFACGGWIKNHPVPPTENHWNQFDILDGKVDSQIHELLEEKDDPEEPVIVKTAKRIYKACMNTDRVEERGVTPLVNLLEELNNWPMTTNTPNGQTTDWQKLVGDIGRRLAFGVLLLVYVEVDKRNTSRNVIIVDEPNLGVPKYMFKQAKPNFIDAYVSFIIKAAELVARARGEKVYMFDLHIQAFNVYKFERDLVDIMQREEETRNVEDSYNFTTINQLQNWTDEQIHLSPGSRIDWEKLLKNILSAGGKDLKGDTTIAVTSHDYLEKLMNLIDVTPPKIIADYILWRVVQKMSRDLNQEMLYLNARFRKQLSAITEDYPRWRHCVASVNYLAFVVGYMYVRKHFSEEARSKAIEMVEDIRSAFIQKLEENPWMDEESKKHALEKVEAMTEFIGYPDWFGNITYLEEYYEGVDVGEDHFENKLKLRELLARKYLNKFKMETNRDEWVVSPAITNAFYNPYFNSIIFPAGVLQDPFFNKDQPRALNYGSVGVIVGHEITHAFADIGEQTDKHEGTVESKQWWTKDAEANYKSNALCFLNQYDNYRIPELDDTMQEEATIDGSRTLDENVADNGGLGTALRAYLSHRKRTGERDLCLPGLEHYSAEQLFYIGFARVWCESHTKESLLGEVLRDSHSPHRFRVTGSVSNSNHFAKTWRCPLNSNMNPRQKCRLW